MHREAIARAAIRFVCARFRLRRNELLGKSREWRIVWARWCAIHLIRKHTTLTIVQTGDLFGMERSTTIYAQSALRDQIQTSPAHATELKVIEENFKP